MDKFLRLLSGLIPMLAPCPVWVKLLFSAWVILGAVVFLAVLLVRNPSAEIRTDSTGNGQAAHSSTKPITENPGGGAREEWPAVRVKLMDGGRFDLDVSLQFQVLPESAPKVVTQIGNIDDVARFLRPIVEAAVVARTSAMTQPQLAASLSALSSDITHDVAPKAESIGVAVHGVHIVKLTQIDTRNAEVAAGQGAAVQPTGDQVIDVVVLRLASLNLSSQSIPESQLVETLAPLFSRPAFYGIREENWNYFLFTLCKTRLILEGQAKYFRSSPRTRQEIGRAIELMVKLQNEVAEI